MMKRNLLILLLLLSSLTQAQQKGFKLVEKNPKEKPSWVSNTNNKGFIDVRAMEMASLDEAKNYVLNQLINEISSSVAVTVASETMVDVDWVVENEKDDYKERITKNTTVRVKKMPALQGVTLAKADIYWERYYNKKSGSEYYNYYISYPFSSLDLMELIDAYNAQEKAINDQIQHYKDGLNEIDNVEIIDKNIVELRALMKKLESDDDRIYSIESLINNYKKIYDNIFIEEAGNSKGFIIIQLKYDGKIIKTSQRPKVVSNCASKINCKYNDDKFEIRFDCFDCYKQDNNYIDIQYKFGNKYVKKQIFFEI